MTFNIDDFLRELKEKDALREKDEIFHGEIDRIKPEYFKGDLSEIISPEMVAALEKVGKKDLYRHQVEAIKESIEGSNVVLESPTASGKTLSFTVPMIDSICNGGTALMIYPMKAVAHDQREQIRTICKFFGIESWAYDGDTPEDEKNTIANNHPKIKILLTNPYYLHLSFLQHSKRHVKFLECLKFIVLDESHEYRGHYGCNVSLLMRRFLAKLESMQVYPKIFAATATCENPREHAEELTGREFKLISAKNSLRPKRYHLFVNHELPDFKFLDIFRSRIVNAALACLAQKLSVLIFCPTKKFLGDAHKESQKKAKEKNLEYDKISGFHADLSAVKKEEVQNGVKNGSLSVIFCTSALELGIDIGLLDGVILAGFPDNIAAARQRVGRAGRGWNEDSFILYYPMNNPLDRFFAVNLQEFLNSPLNPVVVDSRNEEVINEHVPFLLHELNYKINNVNRKKLGNEFFDAAQEKCGQGEPVRGCIPPYMHLRLAGSIGINYKLKKINGNEIGNISEYRKFKEAYLGAVLVHDGVVYRVKSHEEDSIVLEPENREVKTKPYFYSVINESNIFKGNRYKKENFTLDIFYRPLTIFDNFIGYTLVGKNDEELEKSGTSATLKYQNRYAFSMSISGLEEANDVAVKTLEQIMRVGAIFAIPADRHDTDTYSKGSDKILYLYENYPGGIGIARRIFSDWKRIMQTGRQVANKCECSRGCPKCIIPPRKTDEIDKQVGVKLADAILEIIENSNIEKYEIKDGQWVKIKESC